MANNSACYDEFKEALEKVGISVDDAEVTRTNVDDAEVIRNNVDKVTKSCVKKKEPKKKFLTQENRESIFRANVLTNLKQEDCINEALDFYFKNKLYINKENIEKSVDYILLYLNNTNIAELLSKCDGKNNEAKIKLARAILVKVIREHEVLGLNEVDVVKQLKTYENYNEIFLLEFFETLNTRIELLSGAITIRLDIGK